MSIIRRTDRDVARRSPFGQLNRLRDEIDRLFERPFGLVPEEGELLAGWSPSVDVIDEKDSITVKAEIPGLKREDIDVSICENTLCISGERKEENEYKEGQSYRSERFFGAFQRNIPLPQAVDENQTNAEYKDGVLTVKLPKSEESKRKQIDVKVS